MGATHDEILAVLQSGGSFWRYGLFRSAGVSHGEALELHARGVDAVSYRDLRRIGIGNEDVIDANERGCPLDVYFSARKAGLSHDEATAVIGAGFRHAADARSWRTAVEAQVLLARRGQATRDNLTLVVRRAPGFRGGGEQLAKEVVACGAADLTKAA